MPRRWLIRKCGLNRCYSRRLAPACPVAVSVHRSPSSRSCNGPGSAMDFTISPRIEDFRRRIAAFVERHLLPLESDPASYDAHENVRLDLVERFRSLARAE